MSESESIYGQVQQVVRGIIAGMVSNESAGIINASAVARVAYQQQLDALSSVPLTVEWTSVEEFKQIARKELRGKFSHDSDENDVYQGDMFSGHLQVYYPVREVGEPDPYYKLRELLTDAEIDQNLRSLKKQADARLVHYDALLAYKLGRQSKEA